LKGKEAMKSICMILLIYYKYMTTTKNELLKLNPIELGLSIEQVEEIKKPFQENANSLMELQGKAKEIKGEEITKETCKKAREVRLAIVKIRT
jgi:hypothetical protein